MVGDDLINDIEGAMQMGMHAVLVQTGKYRKGLVEWFKHSTRWLYSVDQRTASLPPKQHHITYCLTFFKKLFTIFVAK